jgi:hypothetical protein
MWRALMRAASSLSLNSTLVVSLDAVGFGPLCSRIDITNRGREREGAFLRLGVGGQVGGEAGETVDTEDRGPRLRTRAFGTGSPFGWEKARRAETSSIAQAATRQRR